MLRRFSFLLLFFVLGANLSGQDVDVDSLLALERVKPKVTKFSNLASLQDSFVELDPKLPQAQRQIQSRRDLLVYQDLGTHFSPLLNLAEVYVPHAGFNSGNYSLNAFQSDFKSSGFYNAPMPFTTFRYAQGGQQYIQFDALHTQNIIPSWNVAAGIQSFTNKGYGLRQLQVHRSPFVTSHFTLPNNRLRVLASLNWVRRQGYVSGGLSDRDSIFVATEKDTMGHTAIDAYNLITPGVDRNSLQTALKGGVDTVKLTNHTFRFQYHLGAKQMDTLDSIFKVQPVLGLYYQLGYQKETWLYNHADEDSSFFRSFYPTGEASNRDSQVFRLFRNEVGVEKFKRDKNGFGFEAHAGVEQGSFIQNTNVSLEILNSYVGGALKTRLANRIAFTSAANLYLTGYNGGDYHFAAQGSFYTPWAVLHSGLTSQLYEPAPVHRFFINPNFTYLRSGLQKTASNKLFVRLAQRRAANPIQVEGAVHNLNNYIYYDNSARPIQSSSAIQHVQLKVDKKFQYRRFNLDVEGLLQGVNSNVINVPTWAIRSDLFYQHYHADSAIHLKTGLDLFYNTRFNAASYMPMLRQFYYANNRKWGGYPLLDFYVSGEVKSLTFFLKMENILNNAFVQQNIQSISAVGYPLQPMAFRLGLFWDFYF